jgi:hypothetical protein
MSGETCTCGHDADMHWDNRKHCDACSCEGHTPAPSPPAKDGDGWQSKPTHAGYWWTLSEQAQRPPSLSHIGNPEQIDWPGFKFFAVPVPAPPAPPLPASRLVTLTAKVDADGQITVSAGDYVLERYVNPVRQYNIDRCRQHYGIEPEVQS